jgi:ribosome biogenesis GTPase
LPESPQGALVVSVGRNAAWIALDSESTFRAATMRKRNERISLAPGDRVLARPLDEGKAIIDSRSDRTSSVVRRTAGGRTKTMAANVDSIVIVAALARPPLAPVMIDELLAFAEISGLEAVIVLTKPDLADAAELAAIVELYGGLGYPRYVVNPKAGDGMPELAEGLGRRFALMIGQSGVGKSSIYRALGGTGTTVGDLSSGGRGRQTTTSARLHRFTSGFLIDSPGIGEFSLEGLSARELTAAFRGFGKLAEQCRFGDCSHRDEPDCAVRAAAQDGSLPASRYAAYRAILARQ